MSKDKFERVVLLVLLFFLCIHIGKCHYGYTKTQIVKNIVPVQQQIPIAVVPKKIIKSISIPVKKVSTFSLKKVSTCVPDGKTCGAILTRRDIN